MASFDEAFDLVLEKEVDPSNPDAVTNHPSDRGGVTKYGISQVANPDIDVANLTPELAKVLYRTRYWLPIRGDEIRNQRVANAMMDFAFHSGPGRAVLCAQRVVHVVRDGIFGPVTLSAINRCPPERFLAYYTNERIKWFLGIVQNDRSQEVNLLGWIRRALSLTER